MGWLAQPSPAAPPTVTLREGQSQLNLRLPTLARHTSDFIPYISLRVQGQVELLKKYLLTLQGNLLFKTSVLR